VIKSRMDLQSADTAAAQPLLELAGSVKECIHKLRHISHGLRPLHLERLGLSACVRATVSDVARAMQLNLVAEVDDLNGLLTPDAEIGLYRILQEGLNNVVKHADASETCVALKRRPDSISLSIRDDGRGFPLEVHEDDADFGHGLRGMAERCRLIGGRFRLESSPGNGTTIEVDLPLPIR